MEKSSNNFYPFLWVTLFFLPCPRDISAEITPSEVALLSASREFIDAYSMALSTQNLSPLEHICTIAQAELIRISFECSEVKVIL